MLNSQYPMLSIRAGNGSPNHHLWNNHGTWYLCYTVLTSPVTADRIRTSLKTHSLASARTLRDRIFATQFRDVCAA